MRLSFTRILAGDGSRRRTHVPEQRFDVAPVNICRWADSRKLIAMDGVLHRPHHSNVLSVSALMHLREFLARAGVTPSLYDEATAHG